LVEKMQKKKKTRSRRKHEKNQGGPTSKQGREKNVGEILRGVILSHITEELCKRKMKEKKTPVWKKKGRRI